jgi:hypothetical protein
MRYDIQKSAYKGRTMEELKERVLIQVFGTEMASGGCG